MKEILFFGQMRNIKGSIFRILNSIKGSGKFNAQKILNLSGFSLNQKLILYKIKSEKLLEKKFDAFTFLYGRDLNLYVHQCFESIKKIGDYKTHRIREGLPMRGQRTHSNAKTIKRIVRKTVISIKVKKK